MSGSDLGRELSRRGFLAGTVAAGSASMLPSGFLLGLELPVRTITTGPLFHWFGYYDKQQFNPDDRLVLSNQVSFEHRTPTADDLIQVGMIDTADNDRWIELGTSRAWGWQQGCMLQWRPKHDNEVIWNDREDDRHVCRILNIGSGQSRTIDKPLYTFSPDGQFGLTADFSRIQVMRPGYGYAGLPDRFGDQLAPQESGVFHVDLQTGKSSLILSLAAISKLPHQNAVLGNVWHYFNHLLISPDSRRFIVLHRWRNRDPETGKPVGGFSTRMITANVDGSEICILDPSGHTSHFIWRDPEHILAWTRPAGLPDGFYLFRDRTTEIQPVGAGDLSENGHVTYLPNTENEWLLNDTYPNRERLQVVHLYHLPSGRKEILGEFHSPEKYRGEWRCDTHPRPSNSGRTVCIDSPHTKSGRQLHLIDIGQLVR